ncbi:DUF2490 domain-containing protein [Pseudoxanthomonas sp. SGD-10]|nr:DUF2490 domain-containing protein [Pseudoxanthomonas sp. SGD-10]
MIKNSVKTLLLLSLYLLTKSSQAQTQTSGWIAAFHSQKFSDKLGLHFDVQLRSHDELNGVRNMLLRPGLTYFLSPKANVAAGYLFTTTDLPANASKNILIEHRLWQQFIYVYKIRSTSISHRLRFEQRFIERETEDIFSQRFRYFIRGLIPFNSKGNSFERGPFAALQNEVFLHLQNKDNFSNHTFDQNRAYIATGYRFKPSFDLEIGYLNQTTKGTNNNLTNNVFQIAAYTRF